MASDKRRFEMVEGSSSKFWEVSVDGDSYTVTYGRIGTHGVSKTTTTDSAAAAAADVAKLVREKLKKGYHELGGELTFRPPPHLGSHEHVERFMNYKVVVFNPDAEPDGEGERRELPALRDLDKLVYFIGITYDDDPALFASRVDALLADPKIAELRGLVIGPWFSDVCEEPPLHVYRALQLNGASLRSLKGLFIGDVIQEEHEI